MSNTWVQITCHPYLQLPQIEWMINECMNVAGKYNVPISLFFSRSVDKLLVRSILYDVLPESSENIEKDIMKYIDIDKLRDDFPNPSKTYMLRSKI